MVASLSLQCPQTASFSYSFDKTERQPKQVSFFFVKAAKALTFEVTTVLVLVCSPPTIVCKAYCLTEAFRTYATASIPHCHLKSVQISLEAVLTVGFLNSNLHR